MDAPARSGSEKSSSPARPAWWLYLLVVSLLICCFVLGHVAGPAWLGSGLVFNLIGGLSVAALIIAARHNSGGSRVPLYLFAVGQGLFVASNVLAINYERLFGDAIPFPSIADPLHLAFYPLLVLGMVLLIRERNEHRERAGLIDSLIVTVALATLLWVYLIAPYSDDPTESLLHKVTSIAYPAMDILVLAVVARVAAGSHRRELAFVFLLAGAVVLLLSDALYGWKLLGEGDVRGPVIETGWSIYFALIGAAALHPSMRMLSEPGPPSEGHLTQARLALLMCASLAAPLVLLERLALGKPLDLYVLVGSSIVTFALVLVRMSGLVRRNERATLREAALRIAGEALVSASTREQIYTAAMRAALTVAEQDVVACLYLADPGSGELTAVRCSRGEATEAPALDPHELPDRVRRGLPGEGVLTLPACAGGPICLAPLLVREQLTGVLAVLAPVPLREAAQESLATLAHEVALALRTASLTEERAEQRSEARLSSLIKNSSDVICIVAGHAVVHYVSPSIEQTLGHRPEALIERQLIDLVHPDDAERVRAFVVAVAGRPSGQSALAEFRLRHVDETWRQVEALGTNLIADKTIEGIVLNIRDISERKAFLAELEHQAFHDTLTGLPNRALFRNRLTHALAAQRRGNLPVAVLCLDVDDFKNINDGLGHGAGDEVLREVARRLADCIRPADTAARISGDEYAILIHESESELQAIEIAGRVMERLQMPVALDDREVAIATSIGISFSDQGRAYAGTAEELLRNAEAAMDMAKESGKGQYQVFQPDMHARALARLELKTDLQRALDAGEFTLRYQPIFDLQRGDMAGMEALARWEHPQRGTVQPLDFIPLLEDTGLIVQAGREILAEACAWAVQMQESCPREPPLSIAVNVSASQLQRPEFIEEVREILADSGIVPRSLTLELTESVMMQDMELSLLRLKALRGLGVKLAIDDFGTGYSSLNYIRQLPVDILKIDRSFLSDPNPEVAELTETIVQLARIFKLQAVAEGIETAIQLERLLGMKCDFAQGFHFAKPLLAEEILAMARSQASMLPAVAAARAGSSSDG